MVEEEQVEALSWLLAFIFLSLFFDGFFCASSKFTFMTFGGDFDFVSASSSSWLVRLSNLFLCA